jgi:hypothetical protein
MSNKNQTDSKNSILTEYQVYAEARRHFLSNIGLALSCRDPLAEFSEVFVAKLIGAKIADSRVQKGYDLIKQNNRYVQVKYLCNQNKKWINEHEIHFVESVDDYALAIFEALNLETILIFLKETTSQVAQILKKRHANQDKSIQFTQNNYRTILKNPIGFQALGVEIFRFG